MWRLVTLGGVNTTLGMETLTLARMTPIIVGLHSRQTYGQPPDDFDPEQRKKHNHILGYRDEAAPEVRNYYCIESLRIAAEHRLTKIEESGDLVGPNVALARQVLETLSDIPEFEDVRNTARYLLDFVASVKL